MSRGEQEVMMERFSYLVKLWTGRREQNLQVRSKSRWVKNPDSSVGKESSCNAGDSGLIPGSGRSPGEEMATNSSIHAWRILWTEEPCGLWSIGLQRVGHDCSDWAHMLVCVHTYIKSSLWINQYLVVSQNYRKESQFLFIYLFIFLANTTR